MPRRALALLAVVLAAGCSGRDFSRPRLEDLLVGRATEAEIRQRLGTPYREGTALKNNETMKVLGYAYATTLSSPPGDVIPARALEFYFWRDVLVGHDFSSSSPDDRTDFDAGKAELLKKGATTEAGVEALLGRPHGTYLYPLIADKAARASVYHYRQTRGTAFNLKVYDQILVIQYDAAGVVKDLEYAATGDR